ncbi:variable surface protein Vir12, truncated, putative, partial [Plasmodium vivax]
NLPKGPELLPPKGAVPIDQGSKGPAEPARPDESVKKPEGAESPAAQKGSRSSFGSFNFWGLLPGTSEKAKQVITKEQKGVSPAGSPSKTKVSEAPAAPVTTVSVATRLVTTPPTSVTTTPTPVTTTTTPVTTASVMTTSVLSTPVMSTSVMTSSDRRAPLMRAPAPKDVVKPDETEAEEEAAECPDGRSGDLSTCVNALEQTKSDETVHHEVTVHPELTDITTVTESLNEQYLDYPIHVEEKNNTFTYNPENIMITSAIMFGAFYVFYLYYNVNTIIS